LLDDRVGIQGSDRHTQGYQGRRRRQNSRRKAGLSLG
jgi:hypothetical protein